MSSTATPENIHVDPAPWTSGYPGWWKHRVGCGWVVSINLATVNFACPMVFLCCPLENNVREEEQIQKVTKSNCTLQVFGGKVTMHICYVVIGCYRVTPNKKCCIRHNQIYGFVWKYGTPPYPIVSSSCVPLYKWKFLIFRGMTWVAEWKVLHTSCHHFRAHNHRSISSISNIHKLPILAFLSCHVDGKLLVSSSNWFPIC